MKRELQFFILFLFAGSLTGQIAITEFLNHVTGNESTDEWVELFNFSAAPVDINGWSILDDDLDADVITSSSYIIPPGGYIIIAKNKAAFEAQWAGGVVRNDVLEVPGLTLANGADEIKIEDAADNEIWELEYSNDETSGRATFFTETTYTSNVWEIVRNGNDVMPTSLGYESNNATTDPLAVTSTTGDVGSPLNDPALPIVLATLTAKPVNQGVIINWTTSTEENNWHFIVERSEDGRYFREIGQVSGSGYSTTEQVYEYLDRTPSNGTNYYRLIQVDYDGASTIYGPVAANVEREFTITPTVYPNPASDFIQISGELADATQITLLDVMGRPISSATFSLMKNSNGGQLAVDQLKSGLYFLRFENGDYLRTVRFTKQ